MPQTKANHRRFLVRGIGGPSNPAAAMQWLPEAVNEGELAFNPSSASCGGRAFVLLAGDHAEGVRCVRRAVVPTGR
jgi:hypothetical protein